MKVGDEITKDVVVNSFSKCMTVAEWYEFVQEVNSKLAFATGKSYVEFLVEDEYGMFDVGCELELVTTVTQEDVDKHEKAVEHKQQLERISIRNAIKGRLDTYPEIADVYDEPIIPRMYMKYAGEFYEYDKKYPGIVEETVRLWKVARRR